MAKLLIPERSYLWQRLMYDFKTGLLTWRYCQAMPKNWNARFAGTPAFTADNGEGYRSGRIDSVTYKAHRVIWKMVYNFDPLQIDHINGNKSDNRLINLRSVSHSENQRNKRIGKKNTSGVVGVYFKKHSGKWQARIGAEGKEISLGYFESKELAELARKDAEKMFGYGPELGAPPKFPRNPA